MAEFYLLLALGYLFIIFLTMYKRGSRGRIARSLIFYALFLVIGGVVQFLALKGGTRFPEYKRSEVASSPGSIIPGDLVRVAQPRLPRSAGKKCLVGDIRVLLVFCSDYHHDHPNCPSGITGFEV